VDASDRERAVAVLVDNLIRTRLPPALTRTISLSVRFAKVGVRPFEWAGGRGGAADMLDAQVATQRSRGAD